MSSKEIVFQFDKAIIQNATLISLIRQLVKLLGGTEVYIEDQTKLVVRF